MNLKPMGDKIVVKPVTRIKSQIIEVVMNEADNMGTVVAVGAGKKLPNGRREAMPIEVGQFVRFGTMGHESKDEYLKFTEYFENNERYLIMSWQDICWIQPKEDQNDHQTA
jgi:chaperonin GroES